LNAASWVVIRVSAIVDEEAADAVAETRTKNKIRAANIKVTEFKQLCWTHTSKFYIFVHPH
jgi:hypothetical protein